jgi:hypothetical protein
MARRKALSASSYAGRLGFVLAGMKIIVRSLCPSVGASSRKREVPTMATKLLPWDSHSWSTRELNLPDGGRARQYSCHHCGRHFVEEPTGLRYAVHIGVQAFERLADEVTIRWLATSCPDRRLDADYQDHLTRASGQFEIWTQVTDLRRLSQKHPF